MTGIEYAETSRASYSPDGGLFSIWDFESPVKLSDPDVLASGNGYAVSWSPDIRFLTLGTTGGTYITTYERYGTEFVKLPDPVLPPGWGLSVDWSPDERFLAVAHTASPYITVYERNGTTLTKLANPDTLPPDTGRSVAWSPDGRMLTIAHNTSPAITTYHTSSAEPNKLLYLGAGDHKEPMI